MTALPTTPQAPAAPASTDPAPPPVGLEDIMGSGAAAVAAASRPAGQPEPIVTLESQAPNTTNLNELSKFFGVPEGADAATTQAALRPVIDMIAKGGMNQANQENYQAPAANQYGQIAPAQPNQAPAKPEGSAAFDVSSIDLSDASPQIVKAFEAVAAHSQKAIEVANHNAAQAVRSAQSVQQQFTRQADQVENSQRQEVESRAVNYLDALASPKYGVGASRTLVQTMNAEQVMKTAGHLIRGMKSYGQVMPIESVMSAAILATDGVMPAAAPAALPTPTAALAPQTPTGTAPPANRQSVGSTGSAGHMMADPEYMDGARAILAR